MLESITETDFDSVLQINKAGQPGVALLSVEELHLIQESASAFLALKEGGVCCAYLIAYDHISAYEGEEFRWFRENLPEPFLYVDQIAVDQPYRAAGVGTKLYALLEGSAAVKDLSSLTCEVNVEPPNPASVRFHVKNGFSEIAQLQAGDGRLVALMKKTLW